MMLPSLHLHGTLPYLVCVVHGYYLDGCHLKKYDVAGEWLAAINMSVGRLGKVSIDACTYTNTQTQISKYLKLKFQTE